MFKELSSTEDEINQTLIAYHSTIKYHEESNIPNRIDILESLYFNLNNFIIEISRINITSSPLNFISLQDMYYIKLMDMGNLKYRFKLTQSYRNHPILI